MLKDPNHRIYTVYTAARLRLTKIGFKLIEASADEETPDRLETLVVSLAFKLYTFDLVTRGLLY